MSMEKPMPQKGEQINLDFGQDFKGSSLVIKEEKKKNLRERIAKERQKGTFSFDLLSQEEKEIYFELIAEDNEGDQDRHGH